MGVNLFFVLSGFLITRILLLSRDKNINVSVLIPIKRFYLKRILRIFPIYYLTIFFLVYIHYPETKENLTWLLTYTFNIRLVFPQIGDGKWVGSMYHLWSLSVEEQFYLVFPFLIFLTPRKKIKLLLYSIILIGILSRIFLYFIYTDNQALFLLTPCCFDSFGIGALLAYYLLYEINRLEKIVAKTYPFVLSIIAFILAAIISALYLDGHVEEKVLFEQFLFSIGCFWIIAKAVLGKYNKFIKWILENKPVIFIGKISYGIYLYHYLLFSLLCDYIYPSLRYHLHIEKLYLFNPVYKQNNIPLTALSLFIITVCIASISWYTIESPINRLREKIRY